MDAENHSPASETEPQPQLTALGIDREELIRLLIQSSRSLGLERSACLLESESGIRALSSHVQKVRDCILNGEWGRIETALEQASTIFASEEDAKSARFVIHEQRYLELLDAGRTSEALKCLREDLARYCPSPDRLDALPLLCMCSSSDELRLRANWSGTGPESRLKLLKRLQDYVSSRDLLEEDRLERLLHRSLQLQKQDTLFPYTVQPKVSLLEDLEHSPDRVPKTELFRLTRHEDEVWLVQFSHNGRYLASASKDKSVIIWDWFGLRDGKLSEHDAVRHKLNGHSLDICLLSWSPDDSHILSCGKDCAVRLWDVESGEFVRKFEKHTKQVTACSWMPGGNSFVSGSGDKHIYKWDPWSGECIGSYEPSSRVNDLCVSTDGEKLIVICCDNAIQVFDTKTGAELARMSENISITSLSLAQDDNFLLVNTSASDVESPEIHIWDLGKQKVFRKYMGFKQKRYVIRACFGGYDQMLVLCGSEDNFVYMWERHRGNIIARLEGHKDTVNCVSWCPTDPNVFASGSDDHAIIIWGVAEQANQTVPAET